jgi:signal transduction histidine kinase
MKLPARENRPLLFVAILSFSLAAAFVGLRLALPSDGTSLQAGLSVRNPAGWSIAMLAVQPTGLRNGDLVIAIQSQSIPAWFEALFQPFAPRPAMRLGQTLTYQVVRREQTLEVPVTLAPYPFQALGYHWGELVTRFLNLMLVLVVFARRPHEPAARALLIWGMTALSYFVISSLDFQLTDVLNGLGFWLYAVGTVAMGFLFYVALTHMALTFPRPRLAVARSRYLLPLIYALPFPAYITILLVTRLSSDPILNWIRSWWLTSNVIVLAYTLLVGLFLWMNYRAVRGDPIAHQQIRVVVFAGVVNIAFDLAFMRLPRLLQVPPLDPNLDAFINMLPTAALTLAILRYRLWDIDVLINRAVVYGTLTAIIVALYTLIVGVFETLFETRGSLLISLLATGVIAVLFQPLRERLQHAINHLFYGERDEPYAVLSRLGQVLEATMATDTVLPTIVATVAQSLKLPYAAIALREGDEFKLAAQHPAASKMGGEKHEVIPLVYQTETIGELILAPRAPGEPFTPADRRLFADFAHQVSIAAHSVQLTAELLSSRERLVTTREEERRRIRRDLHDGLGPALASLTLKLDAARNLLPVDPQSTDLLLAQLKTQTQAALVDIRRLVYDLRPPALDELGLLSAIRERAMQYDRFEGLHVSIDGPEHMPPLPAAVEVAAYRIALEAVTNVVRHAHAHVCVITLTIDADLQIEVTDDGCGLPPQVRAGVGLTSIRERTAELGGTYLIQARSGGGTRVVARLPLARGASNGQDSNSDRG